MKTDLTTRVLLLLVSLGLFADAASRWFPVRTARAADTLRCEIVEPVEIKGEIKLDTFHKPVRIELDRAIRIEK